MTTLIYPTLPSGAVADSSKFEVTYADPAMRAEMEGGYAVTRARHTRRPLKTFKISYTSIKNADKLVLAAFYEQVRGGSVAFNWTDPQSLETSTVRFKGSFGFKYVGHGGNHRWDCSFELEQA